MLTPYYQKSLLNYSPDIYFLNQLGNKARDKLEHIWQHDTEVGYPPKEPEEVFLRGTILLFPYCSVLRDYLDMVMVIT